MNYGFYFLSGFLFISGVSIVANTDDNNGILGGAVLIVVGLGFLYIGGQVDD